MNFNKHYNLEGLHAPFGASKSSWLRYDEEKLTQTYKGLKAVEMGTRLHAWAAETIQLGIKQKSTQKALNRYVNDAIGYRMDTEVVLFYSDHFFGTADSICFRNKTLRIHDYKSGKSGHLEQLRVYAALFCLEYSVNPRDIDIILQLYKEEPVDNEQLGEEADPEDILAIMETIRKFDKILNKIDAEEN